MDFIKHLMVYGLLTVAFIVGFMMFRITVLPLFTFFLADVDAIDSTEPATSVSVKLNSHDYDEDN